MSEGALCPVDDCRLTVDVILKSSDGELYGAHQRNLTDLRFPIVVSSLGMSDLVSLEETAEVLGLVLRFMHNTRTPALDTIPFTLLVPLADAVEKYMMYLPMEICRRQMVNAMRSHPNEVFFYSLKHNYSDLADKAAKLTLNNSARRFVDLLRKAGLDDGIAVRWLCYRDGWMEVLVQLPDCGAARSHSNYYDTPRTRTCEGKVWCPFKSSVLARVSHNPGALLRFSEILDEFQSGLGSCDVCTSHSDDWRSEVRAKIANLPKFSEV